MSRTVLPKSGFSPLRAPKGNSYTTICVRTRRVLVACLVVAALLQAVAALSADEPSNSARDKVNVRELGEQVDVLQVVADLKLTKEQVSELATKAGVVKQKREEFVKREEEILQRIKPDLIQMREALASGRAVPGTVETVANSGLKELEELRRQAASEFQYAVSSAVQLLTRRQTRDIRRSPEARRRAAEMVQSIRSASQEKWPQVLSELTSELLEVRKMDKRADWAKAEQEKLADLDGAKREAALKEIEKQRQEEIAQIRSEISQMLSNIRGADARILSVAVNNLASALRSDAEVQAQLSAMMARVLDAPSAEAALKARLEHLTESAEKEDAKGRREE